MSKKSITAFLPYLTAMLAALCIFCIPLSNGDEFWNYTFAKNIAQSMIPYRDFSIVQTPLSAYISALFLKLFGVNMLVFRILCWALVSATLSLQFYLCKKVCGEGFLSIAFMLMSFSVNILFFIYNYNYLSAFVVLLIISAELSERKKHILIGLLAGTMLLIKQNTGGIVMIANAVICAVALFKGKMSLKCAFARVAVSAVPLVIYSVYLMAVGAFDDFLDYAFFGISTFTNRFTPVDLVKTFLFYGLIYIALVVAFVAVAIVLVTNKIDLEKFSVYVFCLAWMSVTYPLCDPSHVFVGMIPAIPMFLMFLKKRIYKSSEKIAVMAVALMVTFVYAGTAIFQAVYSKPSDLHGFEKVAITPAVEEHIKTVSQYIKEKTDEGYHVRFAGEWAAPYMLPLDMYEKNWSMLLIGNTGSITDEELLECDRKCLYLVKNTDETISIQRYYSIINYVKDNYELVDKVEYFDVYQSK